MIDATVHPNAVHQLRDALTALGLDGPAILRRAGLPDQPMRDGPRWPRTALLAAKATAARVARDPGLGYRIGAYTRLENFGVWGAALHHAPSLDDALRLGIEHLAAWEQGTRVEVVPAGPDRVHVRYTNLTPTSPLGEAVDGQQTIVFLLGMARSWFGPQAPLAAGFACAPPRRGWSLPPPAAGRYREASWYVEIPHPSAAARRDAPHPELPAILERALQSATASLAAPSDLLSRLRDHLRRTLRQRPTLVDAARRLGRSPRALQAELQRGGTTFSEELAAARAEVARALLAGDELSVKEVAGAVGFSETSAFSRFMVRETGWAPSRLRG
jgi:AraC-like DNA-binding protein